MARGSPPIDEAPEGRSVAPADLRASLAADLGEEYAQLLATLTAAMAEASKDHWVTCTNCKHKGVYLGPDHKVRLDAAARWMELSLGRRREEVEKPAPRKLSDLGLRDVRDWSDEELEAAIVESYLEHPDELEEARQQDLANRSGARR